MLRIGKLTDYALLIVSTLAKEPHAILSAAYLAETLHLSVPTVSKILKILTENGVLLSVRGAEGGYHLARAAEEITLVDVLEAMEGEFALTQCCERHTLCAIDSTCAMRENWRKINRMIQSLLSRLTIRDMLKPLKLSDVFPSLLEQRIQIIKRGATNGQ